MCEDGSAFIPNMPPGREMPDGYEIEGYAYRDDAGRMRVQYCWYKAGSHPLIFGADVRTKLAARRGAMEHKAQNP